MLADDHRMLREGLRRSMTDQGFDVVGEARDGDEAIRLAERACALTGRKRALYLGTLAAAYAEAGKFVEAVKPVTYA